MHRRGFIGTATLTIAGLLPVARRSQAEQTALIVWNVPRHQVATIRETLDFDGSVTPDGNSRANTRALPLLFVFAGIVSLSSLASALASIYRDVRYGGVVVTARDGRLEINNDPRLSGGTMIVYGADGVAVYRAAPDSDVDPNQLLKTLTAVTMRKPAR
jgi:hypothetical protein